MVWCPLSAGDEDRATRHGRGDGRHFGRPTAVHRPQLQAHAVTQAVCISHNHLRQILRSNTADANTVYANFDQHLKSLKEQVSADAPFFDEILSKTGLVITVGNLHCEL